MTVYRISSAVCALVGMAAVVTAQAVIETTSSEGDAQMLYPTCEVDVDKEPMTFDTVYVTAEKLDAMFGVEAESKSFLDTGILEGPCTDYLGQLCDDGLKCTVDYDYDEVKCLPLDRKAESNCVETV